MTEKEKEVQDDAELCSNCGEPLVAGSCENEDCPESQWYEELDEEESDDSSEENP